MEKRLVFKFKKTNSGYNHTPWFYTQTVIYDDKLSIVVYKLLMQYPQTIFPQKVLPTMTVMDRNISITFLWLAFNNKILTNHCTLKQAYALNILNKILNQLFNKT